VFDFINRNLLKVDCDCNYKIVKGEPVDVSDGNAQVRETDYQGSATIPLRFVRTYNSLAAYEQGAGGSPTLYMTISGVGWSADYFQYLTPVTVVAADGVPGTTVYAHRHRTRFVLYNGTYSPDGDVQTADETIETNNRSGLLLSIARRGQARVTSPAPWQFKCRNPCGTEQTPECLRSYGLLPRSHWSAADVARSKKHGGLRHRGR